MQRPTITLTTDFGLSGSYVAQLKGVILGINDEAVVVDITHAVPPQDIHAAAWILAEAVEAFPPHCIHVVVVDPGVGSDRRIVCVETEAGTFVAPDNGLLTYVLLRHGLLRAVQIADARFFRTEVSATFHGRDIMSPVAAHLSRGVDLSELGPAIADLVQLRVAEPQQIGDGHEGETVAEVVGEIVFVDHFGNLITNIHQRDLGGELPRMEGICVQVCGAEITGMARCYAEIAPASLAAIIGSGGYLEIAVANGSARQQLGASRGDAVVVQRTS